MAGLRRAVWHFGQWKATSGVLAQSLVEDLGSVHITNSNFKFLEFHQVIIAVLLYQVNTDDFLRSRQFLNFLVSDEMR